MKFTKAALTMALAVSVPLSLLSPACAQEGAGSSAYTAVNAAGNAGESQHANTIFEEVDRARDRLDRSKVRLDIAKKQLDAAKARLKASEAEFKAAKANHEAKDLAARAFKLSDASGLPEITESQIQDGRTRAIASAEPEPKEEAAETVPQAQQEPVDLSNTRIQQVDFNAQPFDKPAGAEEKPATTPEKQVFAGNSMAVASGQGANAQATGGSFYADFAEQPPIVP